MPFSTKLLFFVLIKDAIADVICPSEDCPCPSEACWKFNSETGKCRIVPECVTFKCNPTNIHITFPEDLFGPENGVNGVIPAPTKEESGDYSITCKLGECGMIYAIEDDMLAFELLIRQYGNDRVRSEDIINTKTQVGADTIITAPFGVEIALECLYPTGITVSSSSYSVETIDVYGKKTQIGSLADGFDISLVGGNTLFLGQSQEVEVTWALDTLSDIMFYFNRCAVVHGVNEVNVIKDACYSNALRVFPKDSTPTRASFVYQTFSLEGESDNHQKLKCEIKLCMKRFEYLCQKAKTDEDCPSGETDIPFEFTIDGYQEK